MKILIFDDHILFGESLKNLLTEDERVAVCDYVQTGEQLEAALSQGKYNVILLDYNLKQSSSENGIKWLEKIFELDEKLKVIMLSAYDLPIYKKMAFDKGAHDFINKSVDLRTLLNRIEATIGKGSRIFQAFAKDEMGDPLTEREVEIIRLLCSGLSRTEMASQLYISERTLYNHIQNIYMKLDVTNAIEAYNRSLDLGYLEPRI